MPSILAIFMSHSTTSKCPCPKSSRALAPSSADSISYFSYSRTSLRVFLIDLSSSTTSILGIVKTVLSFVCQPLPDLTVRCLLPVHQDPCPVDLCSHPDTAYNCNQHQSH